VWYECLKRPDKTDRTGEPMRMMNGAKLLRRPEGPRTNLLELFFDLAFVVAIALLSVELMQNLRWSGAFQTLILLFTMYLLWSTTTWVTDLYDTERPAIQLLITATMLGSLVMVAALPDAFGERGLIFAGAYVAVHIGRGLFFIVVMRGHALQRRSIRVLTWFSISAVPWIAGAIVPGTARGILWTCAVAIDYTATILRYPTPRLGRSPQSEWAVMVEHLAERDRQLFIISLGQLILVIAVAYSESDFTLDRTAAFVASFATTVLFWRIYLYGAGELLAEAGAAAPDPDRLARLASFAHLIMLTGIVTTAVGDQLVINHPLGHTRPAWTAVILGGPALFLAGLVLFEYEVFTHVPRSRPIGVLVLAALMPVMLFVPPLLGAFAATAVLIAISIADVAIARRRPPKMASPPGRPGVSRMS
jgi:low temperature requirement protein LtrA